MTLIIDSLRPQRPVIIIGAAFGDIILHMDALPNSGNDVSAREAERQIGGCAFNVARALARLGLTPITAIPVGNGDWGRVVERKMQQEGLSVLLRHQHYDNGWCLAIVEQSKERTFITVEGCEQHWTAEQLAAIPQHDDAIVYLSGYELASTTLCEWVLQRPKSQTLFIDFGPKLSELDPKIIIALLNKKPIITVNRVELAALCHILAIDGASPLQAAQQIVNQYQLKMICRFDIEGACVFEPDHEPISIAAYPVAVCDTIAAGDSHCAGVIAGLMVGAELAQATTLGNQIAAIVVSRPGSDGAPTRQELAEFQSNNLVERIN